MCLQKGYNDFNFKDDEPKPRKLNWLEEKLAFIIFYLSRFI